MTRLSFPMPSDSNRAENTTPTEETIKLVHRIRSAGIPMPSTSGEALKSPSTAAGAAMNKRVPAAIMRTTTSREQRRVPITRVRFFAPIEGEDGPHALYQTVRGHIDKGLELVV